MAYSIKGYKFDLDKYFPLSAMAKVTEVRVERPGLIGEAALARKRRPKLTTDGKLTILAADHPARMITKSGDDALAMGDRQQYLGRVARVMASPSVDGVMGTTDVIEDLLILHHLVKQAGGPGFLDNKVILGSMNRSGLSGAAWEMDDRMTCWSARSIKERNLDGAKTMVRLELKEPICNDTFQACADAVNELSRMGLPSFIEPLPVENVDGAYKVKKNAADLIKIIGVAFAMGETSALTWLKIPYCEGYEQVARAATCPMLMLGGESRGDPTGTLKEFAAGMKAGASIRGALVGRNVTFPGDDDPLAVARAIHAIVHEGLDAEQATERLMKERDKDLDALAKYLA
jgi:Cgl0159-like